MGDDAIPVHAMDIEAPRLKHLFREDVAKLAAIGAGGGKGHRQQGRRPPADVF